MFKLSIEKDGAWVEHVQNAVYRFQSAPSGARQIVAGMPPNRLDVIKTLMEGLAPPLFIIYVLHTTRGEGEAGRYHSPSLDHDDVHAFLDRYEPFLVGDGRHDLWLQSPMEDATLVWERHNLLIAQGSIALFELGLRSVDFELGDPRIPFPHQHHYRPELDRDAAAILSAFRWTRSPLRSSDEQ